MIDHEQKIFKGSLLEKWIGFSNYLEHGTTVRTEVLAGLSLLTLLSSKTMLVCNEPSNAFSNQEYCSKVFLATVWVSRWSSHDKLYTDLHMLSSTRDGIECLL